VGSPPDITCREADAQNTRPPLEMSDKSGNNAHTFLRARCREKNPLDGKQGDMASVIENQGVSILYTQCSMLRGELGQTGDHHITAGEDIWRLIGQGDMCPWGHWNLRQWEDASFVCQTEHWPLAEFTYITDKELCQSTYNDEMRNAKSPRDDLLRC
jgi:hypothetical protein